MVSNADYRLIAAPARTVSGETEDVNPD